MGFEALGSAQSWYCVHHDSLRGGMCTHAADVDFLYDGLFSLGILYGPSFRAIRRLWGGATWAVAALSLQSTSLRTKLHPADLDGALSTLALIDGCNNCQLMMPFAVEVARLQGGTHQCPLRVVRLSAPGQFPCFPSVG